MIMQKNRFGRQCQGRKNPIVKLSKSVLASLWSSSSKHPVVPHFCGTVSRSRVAVVRGQKKNIEDILILKAVSPGRGRE